MSAAAFFDIDGTLLPRPSLERQFLRYLRWRRQLGARQWSRWLRRFLALAWRDPLAATHGNKAHYAGLRPGVMEFWAAGLRRHPMPFFPAALLRIARHAAEGHRIFLVSGTLLPLALAVADALAPMVHALGPVLVAATELEVRDGRFTGRVVGAAVVAEEKARVVERMAREHSLDLAACYAYADRGADRWMLERVGHPAAVNPSFRLRRLARRRGWPVLEWRLPPGGATAALHNLKDPVPVSGGASDQLPRKNHLRA